MRGTCDASTMYDCEFLCLISRSNILYPFSETDADNRQEEESLPPQCHNMQLCDICGRQFANVQGLAAHMRHKHGIRL